MGVRRLLRLAALLLAVGSAAAGGGFSVFTFACPAARGPLQGPCVNSTLAAADGQISQTWGFNTQGPTGTIQSTFTGSASGHVSYGTLQGSASLTLTNYRGDSYEDPVQLSSLDPVGAQPSFTDTFTFTNVPVGSTFKLTFLFQNNVNGGGPNNAGATRFIQVFENGALVFSPSSNSQFPSQIEVSPGIPIANGVPITIKVSLLTTVALSDLSYPDPYNFTAAGTYTATLADIRVADSSGNRVPNVILTAGSGTLYPLDVANTAPPAGILAPGAINYGSAGSTTNPTAFIAEPVNSATGSYYSTHTDLAVQGRGLNFQFTRSYNSLDVYSGPLGQGWTHAYNAILAQNPVSGVMTIKQFDGSTISFVSNGAGQFSPATTGLFDTLSQNADGSYTLTRKNQTKLSFAATGRLMSIADRNGNTQVLTYNSSGNLASVTDTVGRAYAFSYDGDNHLISIIDPSGRTVHYNYDSAGNLASCQDLLGNITQYTYDTSRRLLSGTDQRGIIYVQNTYDGSGRVISQQNGLGFTTTFSYNTPNPGTTTITDPLGNVTKHVYDTNSRIVQLLNPQGGSTSYTYDANNNKIAITNPNGKTTQFTYDGIGNVTSVTNPLGNTAFFTYDSKNDILTSTNAAGAVTAFSYDGNGNLIKTQDALGNKTTLAYDGFGELVSSTNALGNASALTYDSSGNLTRVVNALGGTTAFGYDGISRPTTVTDGNGHTLTVTYDALGRRTKTVDALGNQTQYSYDLVGNLLKVIDANGSPTAYQYDNLNNLVTVTDALGHNTGYGYDANSNRVSFTNAKGGITNYVYDSLNRRIRVTDPLGFASSYSYDASGNIVSVTDANGKIETITRDSLSRPLSRAYADGNVISYAYDVNENRTSMTDSHGVTNYGYDGLNRIVLMNPPSGSIVKYGYDAVGHRSSLTYPDGRVVTYAYDAAGRLSQVTDWLARKTTYTYDAAGNRIAVAMGNGANSTFAYDNASRLLTVVNRSGSKVLTSFVYSLDTAGNRTRVTDVSGGLTLYGYDPLNRLTAWTAPSGQLTSYGYDIAGNRISMTSSAGTTTYTYDADDRMLTAGTSSFTYDGDGNRLTKTTGASTVSYAFDALNRLTAVTGGSIATQYQYDGDGNRISQQAGTSSYQYSVDVARRNPAVLSENGSDGNIDFQYGLTMLSGSSSSLEQFYQADGVGSTADVTDATDTLKASYTYDPWGKLLNPIDPLGTKDKFKFAGEALDPQTGLYYLRARYYDPTVGRFISKDALSGSARVPLSRNRYGYALANPLRYTDTLGLAAEPGSGDQGFLHSGALGGMITSTGTINTTSLTPPPSSGTQGPPGTFGSTGLGSGGFWTFFSNFYSLGSLFIEIPEPIELPLDILTDPGGDIGACPPGETCGSQIESFPLAPTDPAFNLGDYDYLHPAAPGVPTTDGNDFGDFGDAKVSPPGLVVPSKLYRMLPRAANA